VAIKVLPALVSGDVDRLARFQREAEVLAALNHPNIAQIHGLEKSEGQTALVLELVEGPTLADRLAHGPLPIDDTLAIARQVAEALEAAHERGIIHRDLKPANIKIRDDGTAKVLDFGLAKAIDPIGVQWSGLSQSPTLTTPAMTQAGIVLGTAAYMSPEQARGRTVDRRTDIWAFGCVLYEMLAGKRAFGGEDTVSDTLAEILKGEPDWTALPAGTPPAIRSLLQRCLRKDVRRRLPDIGQARIEIEEADSNPASTTQTVTPPAAPRGSYLWPALAALALVSTAGLAVWNFLAPDPPRRVVRFDFETGGPPHSDLFVGQPLSPDGRALAYVANFEGEPFIWVRELDSSTPRRLPATEGVVRGPSWSPDSQHLVFFADGKLKRVAVSGGPSVDLCNEPGRDVAWGPGDVILIGGQRRPLHQVPPLGGRPTPVTELGPNETTHDYPNFLPDGRHFLFMARRGAATEDWDVFVGSLDSKERRLVPGIHAETRYSPTGHLLFGRDTALMAQPFDLDRLELTGDAFQIAERFGGGPKASHSASLDGSLAYLPPQSAQTSQLVWFDRAGKQLGVAAPFAEYGRVEISSDGKQLAFDRRVGFAHDIFVLDLQTGSVRRVVSHAAADLSPIWSPDGRTIAFASSRDPAGNAGPRNVRAGQLYQRSVSVVGEDTPLLKTDEGKVPTDWTRDGQYLAYISRDDVWALPFPAADGAKPLRVTDTPFAEAGARFSPNGRWIAYQSNESGTQPEVYVQAFPASGAKHLVSANGGRHPRWSADGKELFYIAPDSTLMSVSIKEAGSELHAGAPLALFRARAFDENATYGVGRDGRFLMPVAATDRTAAPLTVIVNWVATLKKY
jgi:serine/threonine protein kinase